MRGGINPRRREAGRLGSLAGALPLFASAAPAQESGPPLPPPRPDKPGEAPASEPADGPRSDGNPSAPDPDPEEKAAALHCLERLTGLGLRFETRPPVRDNQCGIDNPVLVSALPNAVAVVPESLMACPVAESIARWVNDAVAPEAERQFQSPPTKLLIGTSYQCRDQRNGEKLSEHAFGNGLDIMGFEFAKRSPVSIGGHAEGSPEAAFQEAIRKAACPIFTTVLGPGSDAAHGEHLHLDLRQRKGDYRLCQ